MRIARQQILPDDVGADFAAFEERKVGKLVVDECLQSLNCDGLIWMETLLINRINPQHAIMENMSH